MWSMSVNETICKQEYVDVNEMCDSTQENTGPNVVHGPAERLVMAIPNDIRSPTGNLPCTDKYGGPYEFEVMLSSANNSRHAWVYSPKLEKVFIDVDKVLLLQFKLNTHNVIGLRVRALLVYIIPDHMNLPVNRCTLHLFRCDPNHMAHASKDNCLCKDYNYAGHILTTDHANAIYEYNAESGRHSVVVPLDMPHAGSDCTTIAYQFGCKTSCAGGMSRRPTNIVFTLETEHGQVIGRNSISVKVCSCPKRDKEREENDDYVRDDSPFTEPRVSGNRRRASQNAERLQVAKTIKVEGQPSLEIPQSDIGILYEHFQQFQLHMQRNFTDLLDLKQRQHSELVEQNQVHHNKVVRILTTLSDSVQELNTVVCQGCKKTSQQKSVAKKLHLCDEQMQ